MKKIILILIGALSLLNFSTAIAAVTGDTGYVTLIFSNANDDMAVSLSTGFPNANAANQCSAGSSWAFVPKGMKPSLLLAKALGKQVTVEVSGCHSNGGWLNAVNLYVLD